MMPIQNNNSEIVCRWTAALRHRARLIDEDMNLAIAGAQRAATWSQSLVRMRRAIEKSERMRERRKGLVNQVSSIIYGFEDSDSEYEDEGDLEQEDNGSFLVSFISAVMADAYINLGMDSGDSFGGPAQDEAVQEAKKKLKRRSVFKPKAGRARDSKERDLRRNSSIIQDIHTLAPLEPYEVEDELWENQRWRPKTGWGAKSLLPTDRAPFTDRIGRGNYKSLEDAAVPHGWDEVSSWELDLTGQINGQCGDDGWTYAIDFPPLDSSKARGKPRITKGVRTVVRRRRWFRRRKPSKKTRIESPVIWHGWLGRQSSSSGRWVSRYAVLTRGLRLHGKNTGVALSYFRYEFPQHLDIVGTNNYEAWSELTPKHLKTYSLDGANVIYKNSSSPKAPYKFQVRLATQQDALEFNCCTLEERENWVGAIEHSVKDQKARFTLAKSLTKSLQLSSSLEVTKVPRYKNTILDRLVPMQVDNTFHLMFEDETFMHEFFEFNKATLLGKPGKVKWDNGLNKGSRRELRYQFSSKRALYGGCEIIQKQKLVRIDRGHEYQIDGSLQSPESPFGNIYIDELRICLSDYKGKLTRLTISHRINLRSDDDEVRQFVESSALSQVLEHYSDRFLPYLTRVIKRRAKEEKEGKRDMQFASPTGIMYEMDRLKKSMTAFGYQY